MIENLVLLPFFFVIFIVFRVPVFHRCLLWRLERSHAM